jgi:hypothetical protein
MLDLELYLEIERFHDRRALAICNWLSDLNN